MGKHIFSKKSLNFTIYFLHVKSKLHLFQTQKRVLRIQQLSNRFAPLLNIVVAETFRPRYKIIFNFCFSFFKIKGFAILTRDVWLIFYLKFNYLWYQICFSFVSPSWWKGVHINVVHFRVWNSRGISCKIMKLLGNIIWQVLITILSSYWTIFVTTLYLILYVKRSNLTVMIRFLTRLW